MNDKAKAFESYLKQEHIHCFLKEERNDKLHTVLYKTHIDCEDQKLPKRGLWVIGGYNV